LIKKKRIRNVQYFLNLINSAKILIINAKKANIGFTSFQLLISKDAKKKLKKLIFRTRERNHKTLKNGSILYKNDNN